MDAARHRVSTALVTSTPYPTAELAEEYLARPNATLAWLFLRGQRPATRHHPASGTTSALPRRYLQALDRAPRLATADPRLPALGRWQGAKIAHERQFGVSPTRHGAARRRGERAEPTSTDVQFPSIRPETLVVEVRDPDGARPWRGRYGLVVVDGEALLYPCRVDAVAFRFRAYAGRETGEGGPVAPDERRIDVALRRLVAALQAELDAADRAGAA